MAENRSATGSRADLRGVASALLVCAVFGLAWAIAGANALDGWGSPWLLVIAGVFGFFLLSRSILLRKASNMLPPDGDGARLQQRMKRFRLIVVLEFVFIGAAVAVCSATGHGELIIPLIALIVGVHFFPLAWLFQVRSYYVTGALLCGLVLLTLLLVPAQATRSVGKVHVWWAVVGFGAALILWGTALHSWFRARTILSHVSLG
jgi:hypothetical protein